MSRIPKHSLDDALAGSRDCLKAVAERYGMTPNVYAQMAHAPAVMNGLGALGQAIEEHSTLDRRARATIALAVAAANQLRLLPGGPQRFESDVHPADSAGLVGRSNHRTQAKAH